MKSTTICPRCGVSFTRVHSVDKPPIFCSVPCARRDRDRTSASQRAWLRARVGPAAPNWKGGAWIARRADGDRAFVMVDDAMRARLGTTSPYGRRARVNWLLAHPGETLHPSEPIHHLNRDTLDDRPENLEKKPSQRVHAAEHADLAPINARRQRERRPDVPCPICAAPVRPWLRYCSPACAARGNSGPNNPNHGRPHSQETKDRIAVTKRGRRDSPETRARKRAARAAYLARRAQGSA